MPGFNSIINSLLRIFSVPSVTTVYKAVIKLHPKSENLSDPILSDHAFRELASSWFTRHAFESCRGWQWPFWITSQSSSTGQAFVNPNLSPTLVNQQCRDAIAIPGLARHHAGTMDRRGMITPREGGFSVETWFKIGNQDTIFPANIHQESEISYSASSGTVAVSLRRQRCNLSIRASAVGSEDFQFIHLQVSCSPDHENEESDISIFFSIRPYHLYGMTSLQDLVYNSRGFWMSESRIIAWSAQRPDISWASDASHDDAAAFLMSPPERTAARCSGGMATAVSMLRGKASSHHPFTADLVIPLEPTVSRSFPFIELSDYLKTGKHYSKATLQQLTDNDHGQTLNVCSYQLSALTDYSLPAMRQEFMLNNRWFHVAVEALLKQGQQQHAAGLLGFVSLSIQKNGYIQLSGGHWALHGQFLTALASYHEHLKTAPGNSLVNYHKVRSVARWIMRKRREVAHAHDKPKGVLPPGVTASGTGTEYNIVDNLWCLEGLMAASSLARSYQEHADADIFRKDADFFSIRISNAIHRELEYGFSQLVPGRLNRSYDPVTASELLDLILLPESQRMLKSEEWFKRLIDALYTPSRTETPNSIGIIPRPMDQYGIYPARRMLLARGMQTFEHPEWRVAADEIEHIKTPMGIWTECINPLTRMGTGRSPVDIEATALYILLRHHGTL